MGPEATIYLFIGAAILAGVVLGYVLLRNGWRKAFGAVFLGHALTAGAMVLSLLGDSARMSGLAMAILLSVFVLPATLGLVLGGALGWMRGRRGLS